MLTQSQLKQLFSQYGFRPLKRYGENYLVDANIKDKIIEAMGLSDSDEVLEIGPGFGALTLDLASSCAKVSAVEKDKKAFDIFKLILGGKPSNLELINADILDFDIKRIAVRKKLKVAGNLPYYITTPIIEHLIDNKKYVRSAVLMVQREVANRLLAAPGSKDYSSISCFVQYHAKCSYKYTIKRTAFYPAPEVDSSLIELDILDRPSVHVKDEAALFRIIRGSFNQRRKTLINSLSRETVLNMEKPALSVILSKSGIDPASRPETLSLADFARIADSVA